MNPNLAAFAQAVQPSAPGPMPGPQGGPPMPSQGAQGSVPPGAPQGAPQAIPGGPRQGRFSPQELAAMGRLGDTLIAHLTPGEIEVPPQVQTPKVLATLKKAYDKAGVNINQFTAGSPQSSTNPQSGVPEFSFWSAILPILGAVAGSALIPGVGTAAGAALGGAAGGAVGGGIDHGWSGAARGAVLGGAGGYVGGSALGSAAGAGAESAAAADAGSVAGTTAGSTALTEGVPASSLGAAVPAVEAAGPTGAATATGLSSAAPNYVSQFGTWIKNNPVKAAQLGIGVAAVAPSMFQKQSAGPALPPGFSMHMPAVNSMGNYNQQLGNNNAVTPHFNGYNPTQSVTGGSPYNFYSPA